MSKLGRWENKSGKPQTRIMAYMGPQEGRYGVLTFGAVKAGYTVRLLSMIEKCFCFFRGKECVRLKKR